MLKYIALCCLFTNLAAMENNIVRLRNTVRSSASELGRYSKAVVPMMMAGGADAVQQHADKISWEHPLDENNSELQWGILIGCCTCLLTTLFIADSKKKEHNRARGRTESYSSESSSEDKDRVV